MSERLRTVGPYVKDADGWRRMTPMEAMLLDIDSSFVVALSEYIRRVYSNPWPDVQFATFTWTGRRA